MSWRGAAFVDHHTHLLAIAAGVPEPWAVEGVGAYHRRLERAGLCPFEDQVEPPLPDDLASPFRVALEQARAMGIARIHELGAQSWRYLDTLLDMRARDVLPVSVWLYPIAMLVDPKETRRTGDDMIDVKGVKFYADGWFRSRTAAVVDAYDDEPDETGVLFLDTETLLKRAEPYAEAGLTLVTHAIGDRAVTNVVDAYERLFDSDCSVHSPRIEHAQILSTELIGRIEALGIVTSIQSSFAVHDGDDVLKGLGPRAELAYRWRDLVDRGARVLGGSDYPIETANPLEGLRDLVTGGRVGRRGVGSLDIDVALEITTDETAGTMTLSDDPRTVAAAALPELKVESVELAA